MKNSITSINYRDISIDNGFWDKQQRINSETTIYSVWERFKETGRFDALNFNWKEGMPNKPHIFWDSDIAKWLESAAYIIAKKPDKKLEDAIDEVVELIGKHQEESGYFNTFFSLVEPDQKFKKRGWHELYCAGHLIEAAVAYNEATGKDKFLNLMRKYADHIEKVFKIEGSAPFTTCGHEEIELALVKLYHATGEKRYLELSKFFIDSRGKTNYESIYEWGENPFYAQDHLPVREQTTAEGHAVRAVYLYCAMADLAREYYDEELLSACKKIFENIATRRMYITGGIGSSSNGEAFTIDYDLPNLTAYTESCAAIGLAFFARRMLLLEANSLYSDITERILYNGFMSSKSLDGKAFFYENPLEIQPELINRDVSVNTGKTRLPITQRKEVFDCSCCPPNITRFIASIGDLLYTSDDNTLFVHHYMSSSAKTTLNGTALEIIQQTAYPLDGNITVKIKGTAVNRAAFRIPYWCKGYSFKINGNVIAAKDVLIQKGYAYITLASQDINTIDVVFNMDVQLIGASPKVQENSGRVAVQRGPVVYCLEAVDNGNLLRDIRLDAESGFELIYDDYFGVPTIKAKGFRRDTEGFESSLYNPISSETNCIDLKFIPYFGFANRGESEMLVWVLK